MKRIKLMLLAVTVVTAVGGAFAFNAKFADTICYTNSVDNKCPAGLFCQTKALASDPTEGTTRCYTIAENPDVDCTTIQCTDLGNLPAPQH